MEEAEEIKKRQRLKWREVPMDVDCDDDNSGCVVEKDHANNGVSVPAVPLDQRTTTPPAG